MTVALVSTVCQYSGSQWRAVCVCPLPASAQALTEGRVGHISTSGFFKSLMLVQSKRKVIGISLSDCYVTNCI